jgi:hypothetical protein
MPTLRIDKPLKGMLKRYGIPNAKEGAAHEYFLSNGIDVNRPGFEGHITPGRIFDGTPITDGINSNVRSMVNDPSQANPASWLILSGLSGTAPRVVKLVNGAYNASFDIAADAGDNFTTLPAATGSWGDDVAMYSITTTQYVFYSWRDNDDADVGLINVATGGQDDDYMSTVPTGKAKLTTRDVPHRLVEGGDKKLYISDGQYLASFDGVTFTPQAYDAGSGWVIVDIRSWKEFLVIVSVKTGTSFNLTDFNNRSRACFWDYSETGLGLVYDIDDPVASSAFVADGTLYLFSHGRNNTGKLRLFNGSDFSTKKEWMVNQFGFAPFPSCIEFYQGQIMWTPFDTGGGYVLAYDPLYDALHLPLLQYDGTVTSSSAVAPIKNLYQDNLYLGGLFTATYKLVVSDSDNAGYASAADFQDRVHMLSYRATILRMRVYFSQMGSGSSAQFSLFRNFALRQVGVAGADLLVGKNATVSYASNGALAEFEIININATKTSAFYLNHRLTGQISIYAIEVDYQPYGSGK